MKRTSTGTEAALSDQAEAGGQAGTEQVAAEQTPVLQAPTKQAAVAQAEPTLPPPPYGGCWIRNPDGSLSRDLSEHPEEEA